ncbi:MAG: thiolase family protein [Thermodesulfobacteriota bacterium]
MGEKDVVIVMGVRTPFAPFGGIMKSMHSVDLAAMVLKELLARTKVKGEDVDEVYYGMSTPVEAALLNNVLARQAVLKAGLPVETVSLTIDRACCSSIAAATLAFRSIRADEGEVFLAVGSENLSNAPLIAPAEIRWGVRMGAMEFRDCLSPLGHPWISAPEAKNAGETAVQYGISREEQDHWAYRSQMRYQEALKAGKYQIGEELMKVELPQRKGPPVVVDRDLFPKPDTTVEKLAQLKTIYGSPTVTPGNAPGLDTGAAGLMIMTRKKAEALGLRPLATILATASICTEPHLLAVNPGHAIQKVLAKAGMTVDDVDLFEINEAFAAVPLVSSKILADGDEMKTESIRDRLNVNGGAIAIGHPVGASGARLIITLMYELRRRGGGIGAAGICGGLSQGDAIVIKAA